MPTDTTAKPDSDMPARLAIITSQSDTSDDEMEVQSRSRAVTHETGEDWVLVNSYPNQVVPCQLVHKPTRT